MKYKRCGEVDWAMLQIVESRFTNRCTLFKLSVKETKWSFALLIQQAWINALKDTTHFKTKSVSPERKKLQKPQNFSTWFPKLPKRAELSIGVDSSLALFDLDLF